MKSLTQKEKKSIKIYTKKMMICSALALTLCGSLLLTSYLFPDSLYRPISYGEGESASVVSEETQVQAMELSVKETPSEPAFTWSEEAMEETVFYALEDCSIIAEPREDAESLSQVTKDSKITVTAKTDNGYYKLKDGGFVATALVTDVAPKFEWKEEAVSKTMMVTVNCKKRLEPRTDAATDGLIVATTIVNIVAVTDQGFYKTDENIYISEEYLVEAEQPTETAEQFSQETQASSSSSSQNQTVVQEQPVVTPPVVHDGTVKGILNAAPLNPQSTGFAHVDQKIQQVFNQIGIYNMPDTYSKVKAIYDYLIYNTSYGSANYPSAGYGDLTEGSKGYIAWGAMRCLDIHVARCNQYTAAFIAMVRMIGLDAGYIDGMTSASGGGMVGHVWAEVYIGGQTYVFDPQVEDNMTSGTIQYARFCKTYQQVSGRYSGGTRLG